MNTKQNSNKTILVLGGTGKTGSRIVKRLKEQDISVRIGSRSSALPFLWEDTATWKPLLEGVDAVYIAFYPDLAVPGTTNLIKQFSETAVICGIKKSVLLSGRGEPEAQECEQIVINSGADWTIVRASWFAQNFSEGHFLDAVLSGHVALPAGNVKEPFIDVDDIADVAAAALTNTKHNGEVYEVTGASLFTFKEAISEIALASNREITFETIPMDAYVAELEQHKVPHDFIYLIKSLFTEVLDGRNSFLCDGVERALGRKPISFSEYARKTADTGIWN